MKINVIKYRFARRWFNLNNEEVIKYPIVTEKSTKLLENNQENYKIHNFLWFFVHGPGNPRCLLEVRRRLNRRWASGWC